MANFEPVICKIHEMEAEWVEGDPGYPGTWVCPECDREMIEETFPGVYDEPVRDEEDAVESLLARIKIEDVIPATAKDWSLRGSGRYRQGVEHRSLVVDTENQIYHWNVMGEHGNAVDWVQKRKKIDFEGAVEWLKQLENGEIEIPWTKDDFDPDFDELDKFLNDLGTLKEVDVLAVQAGDGKN
jgi:hypothetical protein